MNTTHFTHPKLHKNTAWKSLTKMWAETCCFFHTCKVFRALWSTYSSLTDDRGRGERSRDIDGSPSALPRESAKSSTSDLIILSFFFFLSSFSFTFFLMVARSNKALDMIKVKKNNQTASHYALMRVINYLSMYSEIYVVCTHSHLNHCTFPSYCHKSLLFPSTENL